MEIKASFAPLSLSLSLSLALTTTALDFKGNNPSSMISSKEVDERERERERWASSWRTKDSGRKICPGKLVLLGQKSRDRKLFIRLEDDLVWLRIYFPSRVFSPLFRLSVCLPVCLSQIRRREIENRLCQCSIETISETESLDWNQTTTTTTTTLTVCWLVLENRRLWKGTKFRDVYFFSCFIQNLWNVWATGLIIRKPKTRLKIISYVRTSE